MDAEKVIQTWLEGAKRDLLACQHLYENKDYSQCLFWGHLVIEKLLKGLVIKKTKEQAPYSHDLMLLASKAKLELDVDKKNYLNEITTFSQFARYDNEVMLFVKKATPEFTEKYFKIINQLYKWLMEFFPINN